MSLDLSRKFERGENGLFVPKHPFESPSVTFSDYVTRGSLR